MSLQLMISSLYVQGETEKERESSREAHIKTLLSKANKTLIATRFYSNFDVTMEKALHISGTYVSLYAVLGYRYIPDVPIGGFWVHMNNIPMSSQLAIHLNNFIKHSHGGVQYWERLK